MRHLIQHKVVRKGPLEEQIPELEATARPLVRRGQRKVCRKERILVRSCKKCWGNYKHLRMAGTWFVKEVAKQKSQNRARRQMFGGLVNYVQHFYFRMKRRWSHVRFMHGGDRVFFSEIILSEPGIQLQVLRAHCPPSSVSTHNMPACSMPLHTIATQRPGLPFRLQMSPEGQQHFTPGRLSGPPVLANVQPCDSIS